MNRIILIVIFSRICYPLQAQRTNETDFYRRKAKALRKEISCISGISIKELYDAPKFNQNNHIGNYIECSGDLSAIISCLMNTTYSRIRIKGKIPEKYFHIKIDEPLSAELLARIMARKQRKQDTIRPQIMSLDGNFLAQHNTNLQEKAAKDTMSFTQTMLRDLKKTYHIKVTDKMDTLDVWYLQIVDTSKIPRYSGTWKDEDRGSGPGKDSWECVGMELETLCRRATGGDKILVQNETNEDGLFNFKIPNQAFETMERLNLFLTQNYGLRFFKRRQLEPIKLIEFEE